MTAPTRPRTPVCAQTGSARGTGACLSATTGSCAYCGLPGERMQAGGSESGGGRAALADEQEQVWAEDSP